MIRQIKQRSRIDDLKNDVRSKQPFIKWGKLIYFFILFGFLGFLFNFIFGGMVLVRTQGLVLQPRHSITSLFTARVKNILVSPGSYVKKGQHLLNVESTHLIQQIAELTANVAALTNKNAEMKTKAATLIKVMPYAKEQAFAANKDLLKIKALKRDRLATNAQLTTVMQAHIKATSDLERLKVEAKMLSQEAAFNQDAVDEAFDALQDLKRVYNQGKIYAPAGGHLGPKIISLGDVVTPGTPIFEIYNGTSYIAAFVPENYQFTIQTGTRVKIQSGPHETLGTITDVLPVAAEVPREFQNNLQPKGRSRLMKIQMDQNPGFATAKKVKVKSCLTLKCDLSYSTIKNSFTAAIKTFKNWALPQKAMATTNTMAPPDMTSPPNTKNEQSRLKPYQYY